MFDTSLDATVIEGPNCKTCKFATFNPLASSTFKSLSESKTYNFSGYVGVSGTLISDRLCLQPTSECAVGFPFVEVTSETNLDPNLSGVLGLALARVQPG